MDSKPHALNPRLQTINLDSKASLRKEVKAIEDEHNSHLKVWLGFGGRVVGSMKGAVRFPQ